jgi:excisionase family DNA binding protein
MAELEKRPRDIAREQGLTLNTVYAALWSGRLRGIKIGRGWTIPEDAVREWRKTVQAEAQ